MAPANARTRGVSLVRSRASSASPTIGVNAQSGKANIMLLSGALGVPLNGAQAQSLMDANQAMIEGAASRPARSRFGWHA